MLRHRQFLTILISESLWRAGVVQILSRSTSKSRPNPRCFNDFDFQIALARRRGANFVDILDSRSFATPVFRTYLCEPPKRQNYGKHSILRNSYPPKHLCCQNIDAGRATGNFQYSRKLELLNFLWSYPISSHLRHICASSYLRSLSPIFTSSLSSSGLHILKPHFVFTPPDLHHVVTLSYLIIFNIYLEENIIATLQLDIFTSSKLHLPALGPTVV